MEQFLIQIQKYISLITTAITSFGKLFLPEPEQQPQPQPKTTTKKKATTPKTKSAKN